MRYLLLPILVSFRLFAADAETPPTKTEMKTRLDHYVRENQQASTTIAPLIEKLNAILGNGNRGPALQKDKKEDAKAE